MIKYSDRLYKRVRAAGITGVTTGILSIAVGLTVGVISIIFGGILLSTLKDLID